MTLNEMLEERAKLVREREALDEKVDEKKKEVKTLDEAVLAKFDAEGTSSVKIPGLGTFGSTERTYASILAEKKEQAMPLFKKHFPDLVTESVNSQTLAAFMKEAKKSGQDLPAEIVECVKVSVVRGLRWNRA